MADETEPDDDDKHSAHFAGFDVGFGTLLMDKPWDYAYWNVSDLNVMNFGINLIEHKIPLIKQYL